MNRDEQHDTVTIVAFTTGLFAASIIIVSLLVSIIRPDRRLWPPGDRSWKYYFHWSLVWVFNGSLLAVVCRDHSTWRLPRPGSLVAGTVLFVAGTVLGVRGGRELTTEETAGLSGRLYTDGLYHYSRNPQYVGFIIQLVGTALAANSKRVSVLCAVNIVWMSLLPFAEEPWLREQYGERYEAYCEETPSFVGFRSLK